LIRPHQSSQDIVLTPLLPALATQALPRSGGMARTLATLAAGLLCTSAVLGLKMSREELEELDEDLLELHRMIHQGLPAEMNTSRLRILADLQSGRPGGPEEEEGYDCESLPHMCKAPFHCDQWTHQDTLDIRMHGIATTDGHPNLRSWCMPGLERYASTVVRECVVNKHLQTSAQVSLMRTFRDYADELDASYCFAEGHCTNQVASDYSTLNDMENMCDYRFGGRPGWTRNFVKSLKRLIEMPQQFTNLVSSKSGIVSQRITRVMSKMACAQGIFHCDIQYCKHTYCRDEYYVKRYSHLLPPMPGNLLQDPDLTKEVRRAQESED